MGTVCQVPVLLQVARLISCLISNRVGLGTSPCILGLLTQDRHIEKGRIELYKILKFGVFQVNVKRDTAIPNLHAPFWL